MSIDHHRPQFVEGIIQTIPRQHGAWTALIACFLLGTIAARTPGHESLFVLFAMIALFCLREGIAQLLRKRPNSPSQAELHAGIAFWAIVALGAAAGLMHCGLLQALLLPALLGGVLFLISLKFGRRRKDEMSLPGELLGMAGLSIAAPAAEAAASGMISERTLGLWLLSLVFFEASVFHVRHVVRHHRACRGSLRDRITSGLPSVAVHVAGFTLLLVLSASSQMPRMAPLVFVPVLIKSIYSIAVRDRSPLRITRVGLSELAHTVVFVGLSASLYFDHTPGAWGGF